MRRSVRQHRAYELGSGANLPGSVSADLRIGQSDSCMEATREVARGGDGVRGCGIFWAAGVFVFLLLAACRCFSPFVLSSDLRRGFEL